MHAFKFVDFKSNIIKISVIIIIILIKNFLYASKLCIIYMLFN